MLTRSMSYPDLFIIGAAKAGTSSLIDMLRKHPAFAIPHEKEPHHFMLRGGRPWTIYDGERQLPLAATLPYGEQQAYLDMFDSVLRPDCLRVDASTQYLVDEHAARAIHAANPEARIIVCLRDPVARAYSAFLHARSRGEEPCETFASALDECEAGNREHAFAINYIEEGRYADHLAVYRELFGDRVLILLFDDLLIDPQLVLDRLSHFLGVARVRLPENEAAHKNPSIEISGSVGLRFRILAKRLRRTLPRLANSHLVRRLFEWLLAKLAKRPQPIQPYDASRVYALLADQISATEKLLGQSLPTWHRWRNEENSL